MSKTLEVRGLRKVHEGRGRSVEALRDLTFSVAAGELVCVVGPSGCGKTTLLRCVGGLLAPTGGQVLLDDTPVAGPPPGLAVVFQEYGRSLFPWMSVRANIELPLRAKRLRGQRRDELVSEAPDAVGLGDVHGAYPSQLSGGMQQRVAIARAVAYELYVLLMNEPLFTTSTRRCTWASACWCCPPRPPSSRRTSPSTCLTSGTTSPRVAATRRCRRRPREPRLLRAARRRP